MCSRHYPPHTGWAPGLLQDDCKHLSKWLANRPGARRALRETLGYPGIPETPLTQYASIAGDSDPS